MCDIFPNVIIEIVHDLNSDTLVALRIWNLDFSEFPMGSIKTLIIVHTAHHAESPQLTANRSSFSGNTSCPNSSAISSHVSALKK